jgi:hypothetical protein
MRLPAILAALPVVISLAPARAEAPKPVVLEASRQSEQIEDAVKAVDVAATASTTLCEKKPKLCHGAEALVDEDPATAWCEGLPGDGKGAVLTFTLPKPTVVTGLFVIPHFAKNLSLAEKNARLAAIDITTDAGSFTAQLEDLAPYVRKHNTDKADESDCGDECMSRDERIRVIGEHLDLPATTVKTRTITITVRGTYAGSKFKDTCASELKVYGAK